MSIFLSKRLLPSNVASKDSTVKPIHILVIGLSGAGKSHFISLATGDESIKTESGLWPGTTEVAQYILYMDQYEVHLIDTPGFNDPEKSDVEVLDGIATMINTIHKLQEPLAGVLYLYNIAHAKIGAEGERNIRLLEGLLGKLNFANCTLVTTQWGALQDRSLKLKREEQLGSDPRLWGAMRTGNSKAEMVRFENTQASALAIIRPLLANDFIPQISEEMVAEGGPKLSLGQSTAGKLVGGSTERQLRAAGEEDKLQELKALLQRKFDQEKFERFYKERQALERKFKMKQTGRWALRLIIISGGLLASIETENLAPIAGAFHMSSKVGMIPYLSKENNEQKTRALQEKYDLLSFGTVDVSEE